MNCECGCGAEIPERDKWRRKRRFVNGHSKRPNTIQDILLQLVICEPSTLETGCWEWSGCRNPDGYGMVSFNYKIRQVHRIVYEHFVGLIPAGLEPDHLCRNRACSNYEHLEPVTHRVNVLRGEGLAARQIARTNCPQGHPYSEANTRLYKGHRHCRECGREATRQSKRRKANAD